MCVSPCLDLSAVSIYQYHLPIRKLDISSLSVILDCWTLILTWLWATVCISLCPHLSLSLCHHLSCSLAAGADHSVVYWLPVFDSCQFPGLFGRERRQWPVWNLCRCSLVGTGKILYTQTHTVFACRSPPLVGTIWLALVFLSPSDHLDNHWIWRQVPNHLERSSACCNFHSDWSFILCSACCEFT